MKHPIITATFALLISFAQGANQSTNDSSKAIFYSAFDVLKNMLEDKDSLNYEKAVFITENSYYNNRYDYREFKQILDFNTKFILSLANNVKKQNQEQYKIMKKYEQKMSDINAYNWAIFKYLTDTIITENIFFILYKYPFKYSTDDPYGSTSWENTQILHLLMNDNGKGNCYALATLFKIFSDRLKSDARLAITPHHIYIQNRNARGDYKNVELATQTFPGDGSIQVLTYTTKTSIMNGMAQRPLNNKEAVALNLIYLAKGFQHKFNDNTNDFLLKCADLAFKHDTLSMNALLLKAEITENKLFQQLKENKITTVAQTRTDPKTKNLLVNYEKQLGNLYKCGYREIPKDIQHIILSAIQGKEDGYITTDKTPNPFAEFGQTRRYATLSWGLFDEMHYPVDTIQYFHAALNTKTKKIIAFIPPDTNKNYKVDPVVFALSVDPLTKIYPGTSPYAYSLNSPIQYKDHDGRIVTDKNGNIVATDRGTTGSQVLSYKEVKNPSGSTTVKEKIAEYRNVYIYADNGKPIEAQILLRTYVKTTTTSADGMTTTVDEKNVGEAPYQNSSNCHGFAYAKGAVWIDNDAVGNLLENDNYKKTTEANANVAIFTTAGPEAGTPDPYGHSAKRNPNGTYSDDAGFNVPEYNVSIKEAQRDFKVLGITFFKKDTPNKTIEIAGDAKTKKGVIIVDKKELENKLGQ